jgi:ligand-binding SRPBCC domain-containing protein
LTQISEGDNAMKFEHRFTVNASQADVARFHASAASLKAITPTPMTVHQAPDPLDDGDEIIFTLWMPFPVRWHGSIKNVSEAGFDDYQEAGPFELWHHRHNFRRIDDATTEVYDVVTATLPDNPRRALVALLMWSTLPLLFKYRRWQTRRQLRSG